MRVRLLIACVFAATTVVAQESKPVESRAASRPTPLLTARPADWTPPPSSGDLKSGEPFETALGPDDAIYPGLGPCKTFRFDVEVPGPETAVYIHPRVDGAPQRTLDTLLRIEDAKSGEFLAEDDDGGGRPTPQVEWIATRSSKILITLIGKSAKAQGAVRLHVFVIPESAESTTLSGELSSAAAEASALTTKDPTSARKILTSAVARGAAFSAKTPSRWVSVSMHNLAAVACGVAAYSEAREGFGAMLTFRENAYSPDHLELAWSRRNFASILFLLRDLNQSRKHVEKALEVLSRLLPDDDPGLTGLRSNLAATLAEMGDLEAAYAIQAKVVATMSRSLPDDHPHLATTRANQAALLHRLGDLRSARWLQETVLNTRMRASPIDEPALARARENLAMTLRDSGDLKSARTLQEKVLEVRSRLLPPENSELAIARGNLALIYSDLGDFEGARVLLEKQVEALSRTLDEDHLDLATARDSLAVSLSMLGDSRSALALEEQVLAVRSRKLPEDHPDLARTRQNLAEMLLHHGDLTAARALQEEVLATRAALPADHPDSIRARRNLAATFKAIGDDEAAAAHVIAALEGTRMALGSVAFRDSAEVDASVSAGVLCADGASSASRNALLPAVFSVIEARRGPIQDLRADDALPEADRITAARLRTVVVEAAAEISRRSREAAGAESLRTAVVRRASAEEGLRALRAAALGAEAREPDARGLAAVLGEGEAAVSVARYKHWITDPAAPWKATIEERYAAFVLRKDASISLVSLGKSADVDDAVAALRATTGRAARGSGVDVDSADPNEVQATCTRLVDRVFRAIQAELGGARRVYIALDDALQLIPMATVAGAASDVPEFVSVPALRSIFVIREPKPRFAGGLVAFGGVDYDRLGDGAESRSESRAPRSGPASVGPFGEHVDRGGAEGAFRRLFATAIEVDAMATIYVDGLGAESRPQVFKGLSASRGVFMAVAPRARYLHLATHGFFAPDAVPSSRDQRPIDFQMQYGSFQSQRDSVIGWSPKALCGLAFAGANLPPDEYKNVPGIITAEEIAAMDLRNCELCVLSACDTNVGVRRAGQCIQSLQTALHMAGVRTAITSLWKVPDEATKELMVEFYRRLWRLKEPKLKALSEAQRMIREAKDPATGRPRYGFRDWAAWVLSGDPD